MLFLLFDNSDSFCDFVESFIASTVEAKDGSLLEQPKLLTIVVIDVKFLLHLLHLREISSQIRIFY